jgi:hypothetical protein
MNTEWSSASQEASRPIKWYDLIAIAVLVFGALFAVFAWFIFDGSKAL